MLPKVNPTETVAWKKLKNLRDDFGDIRISQLFNEDPERFAKYSIQLDELFVDFSKNLINDEILEALISLSEESLINEAKEKMFRRNHQWDRKSVCAAYRASQFVK